MDYLVTGGAGLYGRQMVEGIIIAAAVAVGAMVGSLMSWGK